MVFRRKKEKKVKEEPARERISKPQPAEFLVAVNELHEFVLSAKGKIRNYDARGKFVIANNGFRDKIWGISVEIESTNIEGLENLIKIDELNPGDKIERNYTITKKKKLPIELELSIDTTPEQEEQGIAVVYGTDQSVKLQVRIRNNSEAKINEIVFRKEFPHANFISTNFSADAGTVNNYSNEIEWNISDLNPNTEAKLLIEGKVRSEDKEKLDLGSANLSFKAGENLAAVKIKSMESLVKNLFYIQKDEREEEPNIWDCKVIIENISEFPIKIMKLVVKESDNGKRVLDIEPDKILNPGEKFESNVWTVKSEKIPTFHKEAHISVVPIKKIAVLGNGTIEKLTLPVTSVQIKKEFVPNTVGSYRITPIDTNIEIINEGATRIKSLIIKDTIPSDFKPPKQEDIEVILGNKKGKEGITIRLEPNDYNPQSEHKLYIEILDIKRSFGTEFSSNKKMKVNYRMQAWKPKEEYSPYSGDIEVTLSTVEIGPRLTVRIPQEKLPKINVKHLRRKLTVGKSVIPGHEKGEYIITLIFRNRGNTVLKNIELIDKLPKDFSFISGNIEPQEETIDDGKILKFKFNEIRPDDEIRIEYMIRGTGEYKPEDAEILYKA